MIIGTTLFNNEFDMLDVYLGITSLYTDRWIILEASTTFSGIPKPFNLKSRLDEYNQRWQNRIEVVTWSVPIGCKDWCCEQGMRINLQPAIDRYNDTDIFYYSDLDEIINPEKVPAILNLMRTEQKPVSCVLDMYIYRFDQKVNRKWSGTVWSQKPWFENPQKLYKGDSPKRKDRNHCVKFPDTAGWHWSWMGDDQRILNKAVSCIETQHKDAEKMLTDFKDLNAAGAINHKCATEFCQDPGYPQSVLDVIKKYPWWTV